MQIKYRIRRFVFIVAGWLFFLMPHTTLAAKGTEPEPDLFGGGQWFVTLLSLGFVVFLAYWATRFLAGKYSNLPSRHIKVAETLCIGPNRHLYLLLVNNQVLLVGNSDQGITLLKEYADPAFYGEMELRANQNQTFSNGKFKDLLAPLLNSRTETVESAEGSGPEFKERLTESLERIRAWKNKGRG